MFPPARTIIGSGTGNGVLTITDGTISIVDGIGSPYAEVLFNTDGTIDQDSNGTVTQYNASTDWIIPNARSGTKDWRIKATEVSKTGTGTTTGTMATWLSLSAGPHAWRVTRQSVSGVGSCQWVIDFDISLDDSTVLETGRITLYAELTA